MDNIREIPLDQLCISQHQARTRNVEDGLEDLTANIRVHGQLEPIVVVPNDDGGPPFSIITGQRRFLAHKRLGKSTITAIVRAEAPDAHMAKAISVSENLIRKDLTDRDLIDACTALYQRYGSVKEVANELGLPYARVRSCIKFERLKPELKKVVREGKLDVQTALRVQDHLDEVPQDAAPDLERLVVELEPMTRAQQNHYLRARSANDTADAKEQQGNGNQSTPRHTIKQILITLSYDDHYRLRAWAREHHLTQDQAGAQIVSSFLSTQ